MVRQFLAGGKENVRCDHARFRIEVFVFDVYFQSCIQKGFIVVSFENLFSKSNVVNNLTAVFFYVAIYLFRALYFMLVCTCKCVHRVFD